MKITTKATSEMTYMEHLQMIDALETNIKEWYISEFPTDECGKYIDDDATFTGLWKTLCEGKDVYDYIGEGDSIIRERCFSELCDIVGESYDVIYDMWMNGGQN